MDEPRVTGLVVRVDKKRCHVELDDGSVRLLAPRGKLFDKRGTTKNPIAVGDRVAVTIESDGIGSIDTVLPRRTKLARSSAGEGTREQVLVANVDLVVVVSSIDNPTFRPTIVDRILAGAERGGMDACIVINKIDLEDEASDGRESDCWLELYRKLGYEAIGTCAADGRGVERLRELMRARICVVSGLSGVGKSSLLNAIEPGLSLRVGSVSERGAREGRHTTTHSSLIRLQNGAHVVDTPGIRNFGLFDIDPTEVAELFREFQPFLGACNFDDCSHEHEPRCAILDAVREGAIPASRHASYLELLRDARGGRL
ncbi:MAG: ribosome small subunit-dependent GTPase A [Planctomycetes bacterium]|nr:ribosome small subunit-dependent GTPase A [Planctomycetota bacterium]